MGADPQTSVADPWGELHDVKGVWIGDGSAFPTPSGTNPMVSIMALAHRTAEAIAGTRDEAPAAAAGAPAASSEEERTEMATTTPATPQLSHDAEPIVRDRLYIGGEWVEPAGAGTIEVVDSTTEEVMGRVPEGTAEDVDRAVAVARAAFEVWSQSSLEERAAACAAIGQMLAVRVAGDRRASSARGGHADRAVHDDPGGPADDGLRLDAAADRGDGVGGTGRQLADRARAGGRGRHDHAVELPAAPARGEGLGRTRRRLHGRGQAERGDAAHGVRAGRDHRRGRAAAGHVQPRLGLRAGRRRGDHHPRGHRHGVVHRLHARGKARERGRLGHRQARVARARAASRRT